LNDIHTSHRDGAHVCQAAYTISKDVRHSLTSLIRTARRDSLRVGSAPPPPHQPVSLVLSRHGRTDIMALKLERCTRRMEWRQRTDAGPARWVAAPQCQPTNADSRSGHLRMTLTTRPAGLPTPLHGPHCQTPVPGPSPVTARSHRYIPIIYIIHQWRCCLRRPFSIIASHPTDLDIHLDGATAISFCKHVGCFQRKHS